MKKEHLGAQSAAEAVSAGSSDRDAASHAAHTPGPWTVGIDGNNRVYGPDYRGDESGLIAVVYKGAGNKHLIAAAPELLEALKQLKSRVEELSAVKREGITGAAYDVMTASIGDDITAEFVEAEEAIAKAEGHD